MDKTSEILLYSMTDLDKKSNIVLVAILRLFMAIFFSKNMLHPDEYWQATEVAYDMVFGGVQLTWEWQEKYMIRSYIYPFYLSIPLRLIKFLQLDYPITVRVGYYLAQWILVVIGDIYFFKLSKRIVGKEAARLGFYYYFTSKFYNIYVIRCFSNSVESIFALIILEHFYEIKKKLDHNTGISIALITILFFIRPTSIIVWICLFLIKLISNLSLILTYIKGASFIAMPIFFICVCIDSYGYGQWTLTPYNFLVINIFEDISSLFGVSPVYHYIIFSMPFALNLAIIPFFIQIYLEIQKIRFKRNQYIYYIILFRKSYKYEMPYLLLYIFIYIIAMSKVPHKEERFILSIIPLSIIYVGKFYSQSSIRKNNLNLRYFFYLMLICDILFHGYFIQYENKLYVSVDRLNEIDSNPISVYHQNRLAIPIHTMLHQHQNVNSTQLLYPDKGDSSLNGIMINKIYYCEHLLIILENNLKPPNYVILIEDHQEDFSNCSNTIQKKGYEILEYFDGGKNDWNKIFHIHMLSCSLFKLKEDKN